jgi:hypothetical protein
VPGLSERFITSGRSCDEGRGVPSGNSVIVDALDPIRRTATLYLTGFTPAFYTWFVSLQQQVFWGALPYLHMHIEAMMAK